MSEHADARLDQAAAAIACADALLITAGAGLGVAAGCLEALSAIDRRLGS